MGERREKPRLRDIMPPELARTFGVERGENAVLPLGIAPLDQMLGGGFPVGALIEIGGEQSAAWWLAMKVLAAQPKLCALVNHDESFFPPGAAALGLDLSKLLIVRNASRKQALWALERLAREKNLSATLSWLDELTDTFVRRLQLAAESSGQMVIAISHEPKRASRWAALRLSVNPEPSRDGRRRIIVEVTKMRGAAQPRPILIEVDDGTGVVCGASVLPHGTADTGL